MKSYIEIIREIQDELKWDPELFKSEIKIDMNEGIVTLTGSVQSSEKKSAAESIAGKVEGVKSVINKLEIKKRRPRHEPPPEVPSANSGDADNTLKISGA